ncbi:hypothetical protein BU14_0377s0006 [Porphyra umbilicalis]|uniref:Ketoreductase (KR) domain-containing protein n=1 Tax=Porphyra umbilicalis TaxID=2786 RepID=A0A1X6NX49_PORUM|nr:hypothetical protein BU14_0377s0006 [Porphyra umbilicalis]|eukprot:OSX73105.1 hypothetical protein BU14_0377s0006 [Porphyra umbilicalis]
MITLLGGLRRLGPLRLTGLAATAAVTTALAASPTTRRSAASAAVAAARAAQFLFIGATRFTAAPHRAAQRQWAADGSAAALDGAALGGQHYIVTGANAGLGLEVARGLAARGGTVHLLCRSEERGRAAVDALVADGAAAGAAAADLRRRLRLHVVDVSSLAAVDAFASGYVADGTPLHGLVNNAGVLCNVVTPSADGYEAAFATNTLGTHGGGRAASAGRVGGGRAGGRARRPRGGPTHGRRRRLRGDQTPASRPRRSVGGGGSPRAGGKYAGGGGAVGHGHRPPSRAAAGARSPWCEGRRATNRPPQLRATAVAAAAAPVARGAADSPSGNPAEGACRLTAARGGRGWGTRG